MAGEDTIMSASELQNQRFHYLFDPEFYAAQVSGNSFADRDSARLHYDTVGWKLGLDPSALFDTSAYLAANPDVADAGINPLQHYVEIGAAEYRGFGQTADESGFIFDVGPNVSQSDIQLIKTGLAITQRDLCITRGFPQSFEFGILGSCKTLSPRNPNCF